MNILEAIMNAQNGRAVEHLGDQFGLNREQTSAAVAALVPALAAGVQRNMSSEGGLSGLVAALSGGRHQQYLENPSSLGAPATAADGNAILGHVFGSKEVSRQVATQASQQTGIDSAILKQMLPLIAAMVMGGLSRRANAPGAGTGNPTAAGDSLASMLSPMLDRNRDGSVVDDVLGTLGGLLGGPGRKV